MRVLVTGGAGFVGSNVALELERRGHEAVVVDDFSTGRFENLRGFKGDVVAADAGRPESWGSRVGAVDAVCHQAAITDTTVTDQRRMLEVNVEAFRALLAWSREKGVRRIAYASSAAVYGAGPAPMRESQDPAPLNVYGFSKRVMERVARDFAKADPDSRVVGLRYFNVYGPGESFKGAAASMIWQLSGQMLQGRRPRIFKWGEQYRDFVNVRDAVEANMRALEAGASGVYNVCTGGPTTFNRILEVLNEVLGTGLKTEFFDNPYSFYQNETLGDPSAAESGLGFKARTTIEAGIRDYLGGGPAGGAAGENDRTVRLPAKQARIGP